MKPLSMEDGTIPSATPQRIVEQIREALQEIQYGSIEIVIHEGRVVQMELRHKLRFDPKRA